MEEEMNEVAENKDLIRRYTEATWSGQNVESEYYSPDAVHHALHSSSAVVNLAKTAAYFRAALPDLSLRDMIVFGQEDRVMQHYTVTGTHTGIPLFEYCPSGQEITLVGENIFRLANGKIVERWSIIDAANLSQQLNCE